MAEITRQPPASSEGNVSVGALDGAERPADGRLGKLLAALHLAFPRGALILSSVTLVNFLIGWLETKVMGHQFGAGTETDAFYAAFALPSLALDVLVVGGLIASFVPLYTGLKDEDARDAREFGRTIFTLALLVMAVVIGLMVVFAPFCVSITAPTFQGAQRNQTIDLLRILSVTQIVFAAIWVLGEVLIAEKRWLTYAISQTMYSIGIIAGALLLGDRLGLYGPALGAVAGALAFMGIRLFGVIRAGFVPLPSLNLHVKGLRRYMKLMLPKMVSQPLENTLIVMFFTVLATRLQPGSLTDLTYARKFQTLPELVIGAQFAIAAFPALSRAADEGRRREFRRIFTTNLATIALLSTGAALALLLFGSLAVQILLGGPAYDATDIRTTTWLVAIFAVSIPLESMIELVARGIYATKNTLLPTAASVAGFTALVVTAVVLSPAAGIMAIPASYVVGMAVKLAIVAVALAPRMNRIGRPEPAAAPPRRVTALGPVPGPAARPLEPRRSSVKPIAAVVVAVALGVGGLLAAVYSVQGATFGFGAPQITPWARVQPTANVAHLNSPSAAPTTVVVEPSAGNASSVPSATPTGGQFSMDLYKKGDFVSEFKDTWCIPAAMQTAMNIMNAVPDSSEETQAKLFDLANSIKMSRNGSPDPEGWAGGLTELGYGNFVVMSRPTMIQMVNVVVKQIRLTNRPAGLLVWYGWHSWVVSGFIATADPKYTDNYTVIALYVEDVWYPRISSIWGPSNPPDYADPIKDLPIDYKKWDQAVYYAGKQAQYVAIVPVEQVPTNGNR